MIILICYYPLDTLFVTVAVMILIHYTYSTKKKNPIGVDNYADFKVAMSTY